jgi:hypothetical protein
VTEELLPSWRDSAARQAIIDFVGRTCGGNGVPTGERVAVFDNDGTLWCEQPMPIQLDFILRRLAEMATAQPELCERQPWKAVSERDFGWFGALMAEHYAGDDTNVRLLAGGILAAYAGISVEDFAGGRLPAQHTAPDARSPVPRVRLHTDGRAARLPGHQRLLEPHRLGRRSRLHAAVSQEMYGVPRERVIGSGSTFSYTSDEHGGTITHKPEADYLDDGPEKPVRIWNRTGRRPLLAAGNSSGDVPMLEFTHHADKPTLRLLVLHDDAEREFDCTTGAEQALERAEVDGWTVVSIKNDWTTVF